MPSVAISWRLTGRYVIGRPKVLWVEIIKCVDCSMSFIQKQETGVVYVEALLYLTHIVGHFLLDVFIRGNL